MYPAKYPEVIAVSAHTVKGSMADFSNDGPEIDIWAPGVDIVSTIPGNDFGYASGTSMAAPHVAGTIALMLSVNPNLSSDMIKKILYASADYGLLDTATAVEMTYKYSRSLDDDATTIQPISDPVTTTVGTDNDEDDDDEDD